MSAVIVTGAGSGIGRATAIELGRMGRSLVIWDRNQSAAEETCAFVAAAGGTAVSAIVDLRDDAGTIEMVNEVVRTRGVAALIHCAAMFPPLSFASAVLEDLDAMFAVNFRAAFVLAKACAPGMATGGSLVFLTSGAGLLEQAGDPIQRSFSLYGASKAALDRWALGVAAELAEDGIVVSTITPGAVVDTPGVAAVRVDGFDRLPRVPAASVGRAVAWLAAERRFDLAGCRLDATEFGKSWGR